MTTDARQHSPAAERNQAPLLQQLQRLLPLRCAVLEIASGTGQHAAHFASSTLGWNWQPSDPVAESRASVAAWCAGLPNVAPPLALDVLALPWAVAAGGYGALYCANMLHISPWATCAALMQGAHHSLQPGGLLLVYGPFIQDGVATAASNLAFDADLRARNPAWGLRALAAVAALAQAQGLHLRETVAMPANNLLLVLQRQGDAAAPGTPLPTQGLPDAGA